MLYKWHKSVVIALLIILFGFNSYYDASENQDINNHWAKSIIQSLIDEGKIKGYNDGTFRPDNNITRAEFVTMVNHILTLDDEITAISFNDVQKSDWYYKEVVIAKQKGYITGYPDNIFKPNDKVTREQVAVILSRLLPDNSQSAEVVCTDFNEISSWALEGINKANLNGLMSGYPDGSIRPKSQTTRAEAVTMLANLKEILSNEAAIIGDELNFDNTKQPEIPNTTEPTNMPESIVGSYQVNKISIVSSGIEIKLNQTGNFNYFNILLDGLPIGIDEDGNQVNMPISGGKIIGFTPVMGGDNLKLGLFENENSIEAVKILTMSNGQLLSQ